MHEPLPHRSGPATGVAHTLHRDYETRSNANISKVGVDKYAADPSTAVLCAAYAVDDGPVQVWLPGREPIPAVFLEAERDLSWEVSAHNDAFETAIEQHVLAPRYGFPLVPLERHSCTMARCQAVALPAKLETVADVLELAHRKDADGAQLMQQMSKPRPAGTPDDPAQLARLGRYCVRDVEVERDAHDRVALLSAAERMLWVISCRINQRGFYFDRPLAEAARRIVQAAAPDIDAELAELTGGVVTKASQVLRLRRWLQQQGCPMEDLNRKTVEKRLGDDALAAPLRRVLELRTGGAQAAVKKIDALFAGADSDDRVRGMFRYHGAATGRFSGERFQPQNLKRPTVEDLDAAIAAIATGDIAHVKKLYPKPLAIVGDCIRPMIRAAPDHALMGVDLSAIESRALAWVAGEEWKLESYRRYDRSQDPRDEPYCETACKIFRVPSGTYTEKSPERSVGKTCDLAFGYQGGLRAFRNFLPDKFTDAEVDRFKNEWRVAHPATVRFWYHVDRAAVLAVRERGRAVQCGRIELQFTGAFLQLRLPSGRKISYPQPRIIVDDRDGYRVVFADNAAGQFKDCRNGQGAYGGTWTENVVQGIARDLLAEAILRIEDAGYPIVLHVHDEIVAEVPIGFGSTEEFTKLMTRQPAWAEGLPIAAKAWTGPRYCK